MSSISFVPMKCPNCGGEFQIKEGQEKVFCSYCGTQIMINDENKYEYHYYDEATIKKVESTERIETEKLRQKKNMFSLKIKLIIAYVFVVVICAIAAWLCAYENPHMAFWLAIIAILLASIPIMILISFMIMHFTKTSSNVSEGSYLFGLLHYRHESSTSPGDNVITLWVFYAIVLGLIIMSLYVTFWF